MVKRRTEAEVTPVLQRLEIIADTREQKNEHITGWLARNKVNFCVRKLDVGDYSAQLGKFSMEESIVIERKSGLHELCVNLTSDRNRFENELLRAKALGLQFFLVIEGAGWNDVYSYNYDSLYEPKKLARDLMMLMTDYGFHVIFCRVEESPRIIFQLLYNAARRDLLHGGADCI